MTLFIAEVFNSHFHAYEVRQTSITHICQPSQLQDHHPLWLYQTYNQEISGTYFVTLKYYVLSNTDQ